ncbi:hypothetical protein P8452_64171 [Trifolium repens]|nr:hypothetical protein P8452_15838 [Trifolium repens]WJX65491.1 hypothetical protein P8452_50148 [Trifolium repens]WJX81266.1 hypothetical protein P8452_64171 [Trifolium repens]
MASSSANRYGNGWAHAPKNHFKAIIDPNQEGIAMCGHFVNNFSRMMDFSKSGWFIDGNKDRTMVKFKYVDRIWYIIDGRLVARKYGYTKPTAVYLYYRLEKNEFLLYEKIFHKIIQNSNRIRREQDEAPITLSSDSDKTSDENQNEEHVSDDSDDGEEFVDSGENEDSDDSDDNGESDDNEIDDGDDVDPADFNEFEVVVTHALATSNQVFHFPNRTSRYVLEDGQEQIFLRDMDTGRLWNCTIKVADRNPNERMLTAGWYEFKNLKRLRAGDKLMCEVQDPPTHMNVKVVRSGARRR